MAIFVEKEGCGRHQEAIFVEKEGCGRHQDTKKKLDQDSTVIFNETRF
jgi:hypothetical protein